MSVNETLAGYANLLLYGAMAAFRPSGSSLTVAVNGTILNFNSCSSSDWSGLTNVA